MNAAMQKIIAQYIGAFTEAISEEFKINKDRLDEIWKETQKKKPAKKTSQKKPKKAPTAYILFCKEHRARLAEQDIDFGEVSKRMGEMWRELGEEDRAIYKERRAAIQTEMDRKEKDDHTEGETVVDDSETEIVAGDESDQEETVVRVEEVVAAEPESIEKVVETVADAIRHVEEENEKIPIRPNVKKTKNKKAIPDNLVDERDRELWAEFSDFKIKELRLQCENNALKTSSKREDMIMSLITHRKSMEDGVVHDE